MTSESEAFLRGPETNRRFVHQALDEGAGEILPPRVKATLWARDIAILRRRAEPEGKDTLAEIGRPFGLVRETVRQIVKRTMPRLWTNCSPSTQGLFPLACLSSEMFTPQQQSERQSNRRGGISVRMAAMVQEGKTRQEILASGITPQQLAHARHTLNTWGVEIPSHRSKYEQLRGKLSDPLLPDAEIQQALDQADLTFLSADRINPTPVLVSLKQILQAGGFYASNQVSRQFVNALRQTSVPTGETNHVVQSGKHQGYIQRFYFAPRIHLERIIATLAAEPNFERFRHSKVEQICGPAIKPPAIWQVQKGRGVVRTGSILQELGIKYGINAPIQQKDLFTPDCPVPVFCYRREGCFCLTSQVDALREFIRRRLGL